MKSLLLPLLTSLTVAAASVFAAHPAVLKHEFIYEKAPYPSCHASTIVETEGGAMLAAWFGGTHEKHPDVGIWVSRMENGRWSPGVEVANGVQADGTRHPTWNPVLFQPRGGPLTLYYKVGPTPQTWWGMFMTSTDDGRTWSKPERMPANMLGPIKNKPVQLANGTILSPTSIETPTNPSRWRTYFERSVNNGVVWTATPYVNDGVDVSAIQASVLLLGGDRLLALGRTRQGRLFEVRSNDGGISWGGFKLTSLPNPSSGTDAVTLQDGRHLLIYNPVEKGRTPLTIAVSTDGETWKDAIVLEDQPGEYSYPAIIQTRDGRVHVTYTWKRERIRHAVIDPSKL
jgi:predicted neuraminidase